VCPVAVSRDGGWRRVLVEDDGSGGAVLARGHGRAGPLDRLPAVDGVSVDSPRGGPTWSTAELPAPGAVEKHTQHIVARLGLAPGPRHAGPPSQLRARHGATVVATRRSPGAA
jgi:hypothetical protein